MTKRKNEDLTKSKTHSRPKPLGKCPTKRITTKNKKIKYGVITVKSGTVILNNITYDENTNNFVFDYIIEDDISDEKKDQIEQELKEFFDKEIREFFTTFLKDKIAK